MILRDYSGFLALLVVGFVINPSLAQAQKKNKSSKNAVAKATATPSPAAEPVHTNDDQLDKRLKAIEKKLSRLSSSPSTDGNKSVRSFLSTNLNFGGFFESGFTAFSQSDRSLQVSIPSTTLGLNVGAELNESFRFSTQFLTFIGVPLDNINGDPRGPTVNQPAQAEFRNYTFGTLLTQAYMEWASSESFAIQVGMGYVPYGVVFQNLELVLFVRRGGPQMLRTADLIFPFWEGIHIYGSYNLDPNRWGYDVYTFTPVTNPRVPGLGGRLWWKSAEDAVSFGLSGQIAKRDLDTYRTHGLDMRVRAGKFTFTSEYSQSFGTGDQPWSWYMETDMDVHEQEILLFVFGDFLDNPNNKTGAGATALSDPYRKWELGVGVNWLPTSFTRLRFGPTFNKYVGSTASSFGQNRDYLSFDLSAGVAF